MRHSEITRFLSLAALALSAFLSGCGMHNPVQPIAPIVGISGAVHGGQQPISGATIQLYTPAPDNSGVGSTPLLTAPVLTDLSGNFNITGLYTCPSAGSLVYLTATGGSPGSGITNPQIALMAAIGPCGSLAQSTFININELTTVAAVYGLSGYMGSYSHVYPAYAAGGLANAFVDAAYIADINTGTTPGLNVPPGLTVPIAQVNTIANLLASCINSPGGVSGDASVCGQLFALTLPAPSAFVSTDTIAALLNLAQNPSLNTAALFHLIPPSSPFQPTDSIVPPDFAVRLLSNSPFTIAPSPIAFAPAVIYSTQVQTLTVTNGTAASVNLTSAAFTGANASDFVIGPGTTCGSAVAANSTCTYQISFAPTATGARTAYFVLANSSLNPSIAIPLSGSGTPGPAIPVTLTPATATFPTTSVGSSSKLDFTLTNASYITYQILTNTSDPVFSTTNCPSSALPPTGSCTITVTFSPSVAGTQSATLSVKYLDPNTNTSTTLSSAVTGLATAPTLQFTSASVSFPTTPVGTAAAAQTVALYNYGTAPASNLTAAFSGAGASSFSQTNNCPATLAVNASCVFTINAAPTQTGAISANLTVSTVGASGVLTTSITGTPGTPTGNALVFSDTQRYVSSGGSSVITLTNTGSGPVTFAFFNTSTGFSQTNTCGSTLAAGATCNVQLSAAAVAANSGPVTGNLTVISDSVTLVQTVPLYTAGNVHDFGPVVVGYPAASSFSQYANFGQVSTKGPNPGDFPAAGDNGGCGRVGPCIVYTQFVPTAIGQRIAYSTNSGQVTLMVGTGVPAAGQITSFSISAGYITFGTFVAGGPWPQPQTVTLTNTGNQPVPINSIATSSSFFLGYQFPQTNTCGSSLAVGSTCTITVSFSVTGGGAGGADAGQLSIRTYSLTPIIDIPISAYPVLPQYGFSLSSTNVTLAQTLAGTPSTAQTVTFSNTGNTPVTVTAGPYTSGGAIFSYSTNCGTVAVAGTCTIIINGTPPSVATFSGVLPVSIQSGGIQQNITVTVTGS